MSKKLKNTEGFRCSDNDEYEEVLNELRQDKEIRRKKEKLFNKEIRRKTACKAPYPIPLTQVPERRFDLIERSQELAKGNVRRELRSYGKNQD